ncbi:MULTISPECIES: hypothetical protein [Acidobacterium]|uniref:Uncharacterized protein n=1 Tax=Acidobacterium capsulatum (strain ATCC 51196 / DSM 11244 / BCRC 80197 / JCM 7670 / NBRC 15755 / NCIMB 13165 / 161) TaxID=240015 RepID=C1F3K8_ACIC5|nr:MULTISPECIES: hypothetical protein [Acidobacterium]ACO32584.1 hypothetical protein ACP_1000 [Acidobacterium capsulatum ATCC 51196]HCT60233.1 hypothetical protein [Acidobacterium sp.]
MNHDNLLTLKDDMIAYIAGHGMRRIPAHAGEEVPAILWEDEENADGWKEFVETAKAAGAPFLTMAEVVLERIDAELLLEHLQEVNFPESETGDVEEAQALLAHVGKIGYIQLGFAHQGMMFLHESTTAWYERYQELIEALEDFSDIIFEQDDEDSDEDARL